MKAIIFRIILIVMVAGVLPFISCRRDDDFWGRENTCTGEDLKLRRFNIKTMATRNVLIYTGMDADTTLYHKKDSLAKAFYIDDIEMLVHQPTPPDFSFFPQAIACSPAEPEALQKIVSLYLISKTTVTINPGTAVDAGDTLNDLFEMSGFTEFKSIPDYLTQRTEYWPMEEFRLRLVPTPAVPVHLIFDIKITLSNGAVLYFENEHLKVK